MPGGDHPRVLLLWPGGLFRAGANFGVPQLLLLASAVRRAVPGVHVDVVDLDFEQGLGAVNLARMLAPGYDLVGISCYSSFDYLKVMALGALVREHLPRTWLVTGGYHPSARPEDFTTDDSAFDFVVVGDGEGPLARLVLALDRGQRPLNRVLGPEPVAAPEELMPYDWQLLERYRPIAARHASQAEIYLSRGCPFDCAFCMEQAKRDTRWRPLPVEIAIEQMHRLDTFLDLRGWTLFIADALFGMKASWRKQFLESLARKRVRATRVWLLIRVDLIDREDLELMARANISPGFGLESGAPEQLARIRKTGKLESYLDRMQQVAEWAEKLDVPFGANVITGHPGETESSMRQSAAYLEKLFVERRRSTGFLSVDPFRLYPGSPIDEERESWEKTTGFKAHRYPWWRDGDQEFLSEWIDPSAELDYRRTRTLEAELFAPITTAISQRFGYSGAARDYFMRAVEEQTELTRPRQRLHTLGLWHLWRGLTGVVPVEKRDQVLANDAELEGLAKAARGDASRQVDCSPAVREALVEVPRERFVDPAWIGRSSQDEVIPLHDPHSTCSAMHAYAIAFDTLALKPDDDYLELGSGSGYGCALASFLMGGSENVRGVEFAAELATRSRTVLNPATSIAIGDAHDLTLWGNANRIWCTFSVHQLPESWRDWLLRSRLGTRLLLPSGPESVQRLLLLERTADGLSETELGGVRFVRDRRLVELASAAR